MGIISKLKKRTGSDEKTTISTISEETFNNYNLMEVSEALLADTENRINSTETLSVPIVELASLGGVVASLVPLINKSTKPTEGVAGKFYQVVNAEVGDSLKLSKNGYFHGFFKPSQNRPKSIPVEFKEVSPAEIGSKAGMAIDPATMMMAVALFSIEQELGKIAEMQKQILSFLQNEKESQIRADVKVLMVIMREYKHNWNNTVYIQSHANQMAEIKRKAMQNIESYQNQVIALQNENHTIVGNSMIESVCSQLQECLKYYRLSLYTYAWASFMEVMLLGNYQEKNLSEVKKIIGEQALEYREIFTSSSAYLESVAKGSIEKVAVKGLGVVENTLGNIIGSIPLVKEGQVDEWLLKNASQHKEIAVGMEKGVLEQFASVSNPGTSIFVDKLDEMIRIYNHTEQIYCDDKKIYLVAG